MEKFKEKCRSLFNHPRSSPTSPSASLAPPGAPSGNGVFAAASTPAPSLTPLIPLSNVHEQSAAPSFLGKIKKNWRHLFKRSSGRHAPPAISPEVSNVTIAPDAQQVPVESPSPAQTLWEKAVDKLDPADRKEFNLEVADINTLKDVLQAANNKRQECEDKRWKYQKENGDEVVLRNVVNRLLTNLNKFVNIGDVAVPFCPQPVSAAWSLFQFLLKVSTIDMENMGNLLFGLEDISRILGRCTVYEALYKEGELSSAQKLIDSLPDLYAATLTYLCRAKHFFSRPTPVRHVVGVAYTTEFQPHMAKINKLEASIENAARAAADEFHAAAIARAEKMNSEQRKAIEDLQNILQSMREPVIDFEKKLQEMSKRLEATERSEILQWLSGVDYKEHHKFIKSARKENTGIWLFDKDHFVKWKKSASSVFWLHGIAGAGKTMLASLVIDTLIKPTPTNHALAYFYCKYGEKDRQDPQSILSTIAKQLALMSPEASLPKAVISLYEEQKNDGVKSRRLWLDQSTELILQLSREFEQTIIIIDALDECPKKSRYELLVALEKLRTSTEGVKIFVTSRDDDDIRIQLKKESEVYIQPSDNSRDIELFVVTEVDKYISSKRLLRGKVGSQLRKSIIDTLTKGANGMFLWVYLQIENISDENSEEAIQNALQKLPKGLIATYDRIWEKIKTDTDANSLLARQILQWIICAKLPLTVKEMIDAACITPKQCVKNPDYDHETIRAVCQNLVVLDEELGVFRTAHFSVTEFLLEKLDISEAHTNAAEVCLTLLGCENQVNAHEHALRDYAMNNWPEHIRLSGGGKNTPTELQKVFFEPSLAFSKWLLAASKSNENLRSRDRDRKLNPLWVASYFGLWDIFKYLLLSRPDCSDRNYFGTTPIHSIARHGYSEGVALLLNKGRGVDLNAGDNHRSTPLHIAVREGNEDVVQLLLGQEGVHLNAKDKTGITPLRVAVDRGNEAVFQLLLQQEGVDVHAEDDNGYTPLDAAARQGFLRFVKLLDEFFERAMTERTGNAFRREFE
ncbi:hypothetical protein RUND412_010779 [Rhizina undulata]